MFIDLDGSGDLNVTSDKMSRFQVWQKSERSPHIFNVKENFMSIEKVVRANKLVADSNSECDFRDPRNVLTLFISVLLN